MSDLVRSPAQHPAAKQKPQESSDQHPGRRSVIAPDLDLAAASFRPRPAKAETALTRYIAETGKVPVCWAAATEQQDHLNLGDALSAVMVASLSGLPAEHVACDSPRTRMSAVGTIGHALNRGEVFVWGTGSSSFRNPSAARELREPFVVPVGTKLNVTATRGPVSWALLSGEAPGPAAVYGDPVWLLPAFYNPPIEKRYELGVILHLSELTDRGYEARYRPEHVRYHIPSDLAGSVKLISTITPISAAGLKARLDDILSCKRIVSTSLHGMVFAESYGIPCLYFPPTGRPKGERQAKLGGDDGLNLRMSDLYQGLGLDHLPIYVQPRNAETNWDGLCDAIDRLWEPKFFDAARLIDAFPLQVAPINAGPGGLFEHPIIRSLPYQHLPRR